jgi:hypothetical protein
VPSTVSQQCRRRSTGDGSDSHDGFGGRNSVRHPKLGEPDRGTLPSADEPARDGFPVTTVSSRPVAGGSPRKGEPSLLRTGARPHCLVTVGGASASGAGAPSNTRHRDSETAPPRVRWGGSRTGTVRRSELGNRPGRLRPCHPRPDIHTRHHDRETSPRVRAPARCGGYSRPDPSLPCPGSSLSHDGVEGRNASADTTKTPHRVHGAVPGTGAGPQAQIRGISGGQRPQRLQKSPGPLGDATPPKPGRQVPRHLPAARLPVPWGAQTCTPRWG